MSALKERDLRLMFKPYVYKGLDKLDLAEALPNVSACFLVYPETVMRLKGINAGIKENDISSEEKIVH